MFNPRKLGRPSAKHDLQFILDCAKNSTKDQSIIFQIENITWSPDYAESGYSRKSERGIVFGNWNKVYNCREHDECRKNYVKGELCIANRKDITLLPRLSDIFEKLGFDVEWEDEWSKCTDCSNAFRTSPDSYFWTPSYVEVKDFRGDVVDLVCKECAES